jgi:hypothetical protein
MAAQQQIVVDLATDLRKEDSSIRLDIAALRKEVAEIRADFTRWGIGALVAQSGILIAAMKLI